MAQYAKNVVSNVTWIEEIPSMSMIELVLAQDVLFLSSFLIKVAIFFIKKKKNDKCVVYMHGVYSFYPWDTTEFIHEYLFKFIEPSHCAKGIQSFCLTLCFIICYTNRKLFCIRLTFIIK